MYRPQDMDQYQQVLIDWNRTQREQRQNADQKAQQWLGEYNLAIEQGKTAKAEKCMRKAQYWLDRLNKLEGM